MQKIAYIKVKNFKVFGETEIIFDFNDSISVIIGANNSGKTSAIQAFSLWTWAVKQWYEKKKNTKSSLEQRKGVSINRLDIPQVYLKETRYFWNNGKIRNNSNNNIEITIKVGLYWKNAIYEVGMQFKYFNSETLYCQPVDSMFESQNEEFMILMKFAAELKINLLYPVVTLQPEEEYLQITSIQRNIGVGRSASVLRNICYNLSENNPEGWEYLVKLMKTLFSIQLKQPIVTATGLVELKYNYETNVLPKSFLDLDISLGGYGQQQMLLVLAYLIMNPNSFLLIDEPDAHLEILRQTQLFTVLKKISLKYNCQVALITHAETVLNEAEENVIFLAASQAQSLTTKDYKQIKNALKTFGIEHYYKAKTNPHILYIESSTDKAMLQAFAEKFNHEAKKNFEGTLNFYYTQNENPEDDLITELERKSGKYTDYRQHFYAIQSVLPHFKGIAIFDGDNKDYKDIENESFAVLYWKNYELENYFVSPNILFKYAEKIWKNNDMFENKQMQSFLEIIDKELILPVLNNNLKAFEEYKKLPPNMQEAQFGVFAAKQKISTLLENVFKVFAQKNQEPILLKKSDFYQLIEFLDEMPAEIKEKLDKIQHYLSN